MTKSTGSLEVNKGETRYLLTLNLSEEGAQQLRDLIFHVVPGAFDELYEALLPLRQEIPEGRNLRALVRDGELMSMWYSQEDE